MTPPKRLYKSGFYYAKVELPEYVQNTLRTRLAHIAEKLGLTAQMHASLKTFGRNFDTAHPERIREALTDAFLASRRKYGPDVCITRKDREIIKTICETAGLEFNDCR